MSIQYKDNRGSLSSIKNIPFEVKEILDSRSYPNVLRGLHMSPYPKRVIVQKGEIYDFIVNPVTLEKKEMTLTSGQYIDVPAGWAHGFYTFEYSELLYLLGDKFSAEKDKTIYWNDPSFSFSFPFSEESLIVSGKDKDAFYAKKYDFYVLGARGFLGFETVNILKSQGYTVFESNTRLENIKQIEEEIVKSRAKYVICAAGIAGKPTIEWCETHEEETYATNFLGMLDIMRITKKLNLHCTIFGSGQVFLGNKQIYSEEDKAELTTKVYSKWRTELEKHIPLYSNVLYLRIIYPCSLDGNPKCFLSKMVSRAKTVHPIKVCLTIVPSLFPKLSHLAETSVTGILNFVNKGSISLPDLLSIYNRKKHPIEYTVSTEGEVRGNYTFTTHRLQANVDTLETVEEAIEKYLV